MTGGRTGDIIFSVNPRAAARMDDGSLQESEERRAVAACSPCCKRGTAAAVFVLAAIAIAVGLGVGLKPPPAPVTYTATVSAAGARGAAPPLPSAWRASAPRAAVVRPFAAKQTGYGVGQLPGHEL